MEKKEPQIVAEQTEKTEKELLREQEEFLRAQQEAMLNAFFRIHDYLVAHAHMPIRRLLMDEIGIQIFSIGKGYGNHRQTGRQQIQ